MNNIRISTRLTLGFGVTIAITLIIGIGSLIQTARLHARVTELASDWLIAVQNLGELRNEAQNAHRTAQGYLLALTPTERAGKVKAHNVAIAAYGIAWQQYQATQAAHVDETLARDIDAAWQGYLPVEQRGIDTAAGRENLSPLRGK
ncbi:MCP four helix bundle domain-containing protein [Robbsia sp. KACC 23696]|uniref:MCP four helix bundle domain-containing protein n=1 Tax=Robbsia sp. KACC 23696 TaxID=3149231 RepID=UPI00325B694D